MLVLAFLTHRVLDIIKPFPARQLQALPGGWGIAVDDVVSSLYALALNHVIYRVIACWG
jgi:phosphatidylglycerophosphatase A